MIKKLNIKLVLFKWVIVILAFVINSLALLSWLDLIFYGQPNEIEGWVLLISNTTIGWMLIHVCYVNWGVNTYDHYMDKK